MIKSFAHRGLEELFRRANHRGVNPAHAAKLTRQMDVLNRAATPQDMNVVGFKFHVLAGKRVGYYAVSVSGNWRLTFRFEAGDAYEVNYEDYH